MAQDPEDDELQVDISPDLDLVTLHRSASADAAVEAAVIRGVLDSNGIPSLVIRAAGYPQLGCEVQVRREDLLRAERLLEEAKAAGPGAAIEAQEASEEGRW